MYAINFEIALLIIAIMATARLVEPHFQTTKSDQAAFDLVHETFDCEDIVAPIRKKRDACRKLSEDSVNTCTYFASDYKFIVPFLVHHLSLGVDRMYIYNNDANVAWYNHPAVLCLIAEQMVVIQPWLGEGLLIPGLNHCFHTSITNQAKKEEKDLTRTWAAVFDIDEMLVLHHHQCINEWVEDVAGKDNKAPGVAVNWAFFTPEGPKLSDLGRTGNLKFLSSNDTNKHKLIKHIHNHSIVLPHEILTRRMYEKNEIKTISRIGCSKEWSDQVMITSMIRV